MPIAVCVEEHRTHVLGDAILREELLVGADEAAVRALNQQLARLVLRAADVRVVETIAVHVGDRHERSLH